MKVIVTGEAADGTAIKISERRLEQVLPVTASFGASFADVLASDEPIVLPCADKTQAGPALFPAPGGFRFWFFTIPSGCAPLGPVPETSARIEELRALNPEHAAKLAADPDGMASADTVEWVIVLSGAVDYLLAGGQTFSLKPGDSIVQLGNKHRWKNRGDAPCVMAAAVIGATRAAV